MPSPLSVLSYSYILGIMADEPYNYVVSENRLTEWRQDLLTAAKKLDSLTRHVGDERLTVGDIFLLGVVTDASILVEEVRRSIRSVLKHADCDVAELLGGTDRLQDALDGIDDPELSNNA